MQKFISWKTNNMILFPILLALFTWVLGLWLLNQYKFINFFEQIVLWFISALSLFVFELFVWWILFDKLSLLWPILTFVVLLWLFLYKSTQQKWYIQEIIDSITSNFLDIWHQFIALKLRKKILVAWIIIYALIKAVMVFQINTHMPTFDEDAVAGWDMKTKVFTENKSLVLDKTNPEFLGSALERNIFAPLTDTYFLLMHTWNLTWYTNVISPIMYLFSILLLFWIFLRKSNLMFAFIGSYIFASLPFVFVHGIGSYRNFISWALLFIFIFYLFDQILNLEHNTFENKKILLPLSLLAFLTTTIRNESFILVVSIIVLCSILYYLIQNKHMHDIKRVYIWLSGPLLWIFIWWLWWKYITSLYPIWSSLNVWWIWTKEWLLTSFSTNIHQPWILKAFFDQAFFHSDYTMIFLVLVLVILFYIFARISYKYILLLLLSLFTLIWWTVMLLIANLDMWLLTHYWFIRFSTVYVLFMIYLIVYMMYLSYQKFYSSK